MDCPWMARSTIGLETGDFAKRRRRRKRERGWRMEDGGWRMEDGGWRIEDRGSRMKDGGWRIEKSLVPNLLGPKLRACELIETRPVFRLSNKDLRHENGRFFQLIHKLSVWDRTTAKLCFASEPSEQIAFLHPSSSILYPQIST